ncbi:TPA: hypothetical protein OL750_004878 [Klebsiella pneumoniae]|nr:hypothetical protein [Klebsiella pneumoniae]
MGEISVKTGNNARNGGKNSLNRLIRCVCGKKIGPDPRNFNQRVSLGRNDLLIRTFLRYNDKVFRKIKLTDGVDLFSYEKYLCAGESCPMMYNNFPISFDDNHLSLSVAKIMVKYIKRDLLLTE